MHFGVDQICFKSDARALHAAANNVSPVTVPWAMLWRLQANMHAAACSGAQKHHHMQNVV
jgi:hypothetical protein